jgi:hypothetical protein
MANDKIISPGDITRSKNKINLTLLHPDCSKLKSIFKTDKDILNESGGEQLKTENVDTDTIPIKRNRNVKQSTTKTNKSLILKKMRMKLKQEAFK